MIEQAYSAIARGYDRFNEEIDYDAWAAFCAAYFPDKGLILDLACGTGSMSMALARRGYEVIAADLSCDMLAIAQEKAASAGHSILFLNQDMTRLDLYGTVDGAVCCLDSMNYLLDEKDLLACLKGVSLFLNPGGVFVFDVNTPWKFKHVYGDKHYILEEPDMLIAWQNQFDEQSGLCDFVLDVFSKEKNDLYRRQSEMHQERCYSSAVLCQAAKDAGFVIEGIYSDFAGTAYTESDERWYFVLRKNLGVA